MSVTDGSSSNRQMYSSVIQKQWVNLPARWEGKQANSKAFSQDLLSYGKMPLTFCVAVPSSNNLVMKIPHRYAQRFIS